jgi:bacillithiol biosynthesis deacetylase BshB1
MSDREADGRADVLAIAAHRDDVEQTCGGTLLRMAARGLRTAILDLTRGEAGTRGTAEDRAREAAEAAKLLGVSRRDALDLPDGAIENTLENRKKIARVLREVRPRVVILPYWQARHPDHAMVASLGYEACFLSGLGKVETGAAPHRPFKIVCGCAAELCCGYHPFHRAAASGADGVQVAICKPGGGQRVVCAGRRDP